MKFNEGKLLLLLTGVLSGIVLVVFILNGKSQVTSFFTYNQYKELQIKANELKAENRGLYKRVSELNEKLRDYEKSTEKTVEKVNKKMKEELEDAKVFYGSTAVTGDGIEITLDDNRKPSYVSYQDELLSTVHNTDLIKVVNELRDAGAEAIAINGHRVVAESKISCEGATIMIDGEYIVPPFKVDAIGDPDALEFITSSTDNVFGTLNIRGIKMKIEKFKDRELPAFKGKSQPKYMREVKEG